MKSVRRVLVYKEGTAGGAALDAMLVHSGTLFRAESELDLLPDRSGGQSGSTGCVGLPVATMTSMVGNLRQRLGGGSTPPLSQPGSSRMSLEDGHVGQDERWVVPSPFNSASLRLTCVSQA